MSGYDLLLAGLGVLTAAGAVLAVTSPQVVHCALWLVVCLGGLGGVYLVLGAELLALVHLLVYVGAVVVLVVFVLMLTQAPTQPRTDLDVGRARRAGATLVAVGLTAAVAGPLVLVLGERSVPVRPAAGEGGLGAALFTGWVLPFELVSLLLLAVLVGALAISGRER